MTAPDLKPVSDFIWTGQAFYRGRYASGRAFYKGRYRVHKWTYLVKVGEPL